MAGLDKRLVDEVLLRVKAYGTKIYRTNWERGQWENEGIEESWKPRKKTYPHPILRRSLASIDSLRGDIIKGKVVWSVSTPYIQYHQKGTEYMPARPVLYDSDKIDKRVKLSIQEVIFQHIKGGKGNKPNIQRRKI